MPAYTNTSSTSSTTKSTTKKTKAAALPRATDRRGTPRAPACTREENAALCRRIQAGDETAYTRLVEGNRGLVCRVARDLGPKDDYEFDHFVSVGDLCVCRAAESFDPTQSSFSTYLSRYLGHKMRYDFVKEGRKDKGLGKRVNLDAPTPSASTHGSTHRIHEIIADPRDAQGEREERDAQKEMVQRALAALNDRERQIMTLRTEYDDLSLRDIASQVGVSRERVRQIYATALVKMRRALGAPEIAPDVLEDEDTEPRTKTVAPRTPSYAHLLRKSA